MVLLYLFLPEIARNKYTDNQIYPAVSFTMAKFTLHVRYSIFTITNLLYQLQKRKGDILYEEEMEKNDRWYDSRGNSCG